MGRLPRNEKEKLALVRYNKRDAEISYKYAKFLINSFEELGATAKFTIASTSLSLFKNKYLKDSYWRHETDILKEEFNGYYGGRTEAFKRGCIKDINYYDFNSLYPSVMLNEYPDPNSLRRNCIDSLKYIMSYDGLSDVLIKAPNMKIPFLPYRYEGKLYFPKGTFRGYYSNLELRKAIELGYEIKKVYRNIYFKENCRPFNRFVEELYDKRMYYKKLDSPMEYIIKILLNSLYGKFGQKFTDRSQVIPIPQTLEEIDKFNDYERLGDFIRVKIDEEEPRAFCVPIWALYTTAYGRIKLFEVLQMCDPYYCDTDSILTKMELGDSTGLGKLKLEHHIDYGIVVKPKFYAFVSDNKEYVKLKGIVSQVKFNYDNFTHLLQDPKMIGLKFMKFKESIRRGLIPNELQKITKHFDLEDNKRVWNTTFNFRTLQHSRPYTFCNTENNINKIVLPTTL